MAISPVTTPAITEKQSQADTAKVQPTSAAEKQKQTLNASIVSTSIEVSLSSGNKPLAVLLQSTIEHLNEVLEPEFGPNAIQKAYDEGLDVSPEATAQRIVDLSTGFFEAYKAQHPGEDEAVLLERFMEIIGGGIDKGFEEARDILDGLQVLEGDIAANIDKTYELVQQGLQEFFDRMLETIQGTEEQAEAEELE